MPPPPPHQLGGGGQGGPSPPPSLRTPTFTNSAERLAGAPLSAAGLPAADLQDPVLMRVLSYQHSRHGNSHAGLSLYLNTLPRGVVTWTFHRTSPWTEEWRTGFARRVGYSPVWLVLRTSTRLSRRSSREPDLYCSNPRGVGQI